MAKRLGRVSLAKGAQIGLAVPAGYGDAQAAQGAVAQKGVSEVAGARLARLGQYLGLPDPGVVVSPPVVEQGLVEQGDITGGGNTAGRRRAGLAGSRLVEFQHAVFTDGAGRLAEAFEAHFFVLFGAQILADPGAISHLLVARGRQADPQLRQAQRLGDPRPHKIAQALAGLFFDDRSNRPEVGRDVVLEFLARRMAEPPLGKAVHTPLGVGPFFLPVRGIRNARGMDQAVFDGHRVFAVGAEFRDMLGDAVVKAQRALLHHDPG